MTMNTSTLSLALLRRAEDNLRSFVHRARNELRPYGEINWDAAVWDVSAFQKRRGSQGRSLYRLAFTRLDGSRSRLLDGKDPFDPPFADFAKAVIVHRQEQKPSSASHQYGIVRALRYLYEQLNDIAHDPTKLTLRHFNQAAAMLAEREGALSRYRMGTLLYELANTVNRFRLAKSDIAFRNPFRSRDYDSRVGKEADRGREKLPSDAALRALAAISNLITHPADLIRVRAIELLVAGGFRINELLTGPVDCLIERQARDGRGGPVLDSAGNRIIDVGIRYWPEKGGPISVKWVPTPLADTVRRAVRDIRSATEDARSVARWMQENPGRVWLGPDLEHYGLEDLISSGELTAVLGIARSDKVCRWLQLRGVPYQRTRRFDLFRRRDVESALLELQPKSPMVVAPIHQEISDSLFVCFLHQFYLTRAPNRSVVVPVKDHNITHLLHTRRTMPSIFERFGKREADGSPIRIHSHMFRHWLNTLAQEGAMSQHEIARWMGRRRVENNAPYDHMSGFKMAENARELFRNGQVVGGLKELYDRLPVADREAFLNSQIQTAHTTAYGMCMNDWSLLPCVKHGKCLDCGELFLEKGNSDQKRETERLHAESSRLLRFAEDEQGEGTFGANNFVNHHRRMIDGASKALAIHANAAIPDGTLVHLNPGAPSLFEMVEPEGGDG